MITAIRVYADLTPWDSWEPVILAEMARLGIPEHRREKLTVILSPMAMKPKNRKGKDYENEKQIL